MTYGAKKGALRGSYLKAGFELPNKEKGVRTILFVLLFTRLACKVLCVTPYGVLSGGNC